MFIVYNFFLNIFATLNQEVFNCIWNSLDFVYISMQKVFAYSVTAKLFQLSFFFNENHNLVFYELFLRTAAYSMTFEFFLNNFFDIFFNSLSFCFDFNEDNFRKTIGLMDPTLCAIYYPESIFLNKAASSYLFLEMAGSVKLVICDFLEKNCFFEPINFFLQLFFVVFFVVFFVFFFFHLFQKIKKTDSWTVIM